MNALKPCLALISTIALTHGQNGHAKVEWIAETNELQSGKIRSVIQMEIETPWHTYWLNPGEGGMPITVEWKLPEGWSIGEMQHPAPIRFMTGELAGFGYEGTVLFPADITAPVGVKAPVTLSATVSWLACNDDACVPGEAEISLTLTPEKTATPPKELIAKAYEALPAPIPSASLTVEDAGDSWKLIIQLPPEHPHKLSGYEVFSLPANFIESGAKPRFESTESTWTALAKKSPYFSGEIPPVSLVLTNPEKPALLFSSARQ